MSQEKKKFPQQRIALYSPKGGSGKTTISTQLAVSAKQSGFTVCFYDLDPQQTATHYLEAVNEKFRPDTILQDFNIQPPSNTDFVIIDCQPNVEFTPPKSFLIVAPTLASALDLHSYRKVIELEKDGHKVIRVVNQYSMVRKDDKEIKDKLDPCVVISQNNSIRQAMNLFRTIWNSGLPGPGPIKAKNQFAYLVKRILKGEAETLSHDDISRIILTKPNKNKGEDNE